LDPIRSSGHHVLMTSMPRRLLMLVVAVSFAGVVGACGSSSPTTTAPTASTTSVPTSAAPTGGSADQFCTVVRDQKAALQGTQLPVLMASGNPDAWKTYLDQTATANQQLVDAAPADIKASVKTLQDGTLALKSMMEAANYDVSKVGVAKLVQQLQSPEHVAAVTTLVTYVQTKCGIDLSKA